MIVAGASAEGVDAGVWAALAFSVGFNANAEGQQCPGRCSAGRLMIDP
jgi:hypothetical protein